MKPIPCDRCGTLAPQHDLTHFTTEAGVSELCTLCFNADVAQRSGIDDFDNHPLEPIFITAADGVIHQFHLRTRLLGAIVTLEAYELADGGELQTAPVSEQAGTPLSAAGIYAVLKRFFGRLAKTAAEVGLDPMRFDKASTHWMRHTFVRQALVDGVPIEVVSDLAGHASIDTTSIYATQELARKIKAVQGMKRRVAA